MEGNCDSGSRAHILFISHRILIKPLSEILKDAGCLIPGLGPSPPFVFNSPESYFEAGTDYSLTRIRADV